jgi:cholesterol transport system auxiliary component
MKIPTILCLLCGALFMQGCATSPTPVNYYDFGVLPKSAGQAVSCDLPSIHFSTISAPEALQSNLMLYRLLYVDDQQSHAYANHRWSMTPGALVALRIKMQFAENQVRLIDVGMADPNDWRLHVDLIDFNQYFSDSRRSYAQLQMHVALLRANKLIAQTMLTQQEEADQPTAPAGARAMRIATDLLITDLTSWLCKQRTENR